MAVFVYDSKAQQFGNDGIGAVSPTSCIVTEEINGMFELQLVHQMDSFGKWKRLQQKNIIRAPSHRGIQSFRIYKVVKDIENSTVKVNARHIFYDLLSNLVEDARPTGKSGAEAGQQILDGCQYVTPFTFTSDITHISTAYYIRKSPVQAFIGDVDESFINRWGGEITRDNFTIALNARLGGDTGARIAYGKNLAGLEFSEDSTNVATRIIPTATSNDLLLKLPEKYIDSARINNYPFPIIAVVDTGFKVGEETDGVILYPDDESCFTAMRDYVSKLFLTGADIPKLSLSVDFIDWKDITRYEKYKSLLTVGLGDDVTVEYNPFDINVKLRVVEVSYDCLTDKYEELTIGEKKISVVNSINSGTQKIDIALQEVIAATQSAGAVVRDVSDLNSDSKLTPNKKHDALREWSSFANEKPSLNTQASGLEIIAELAPYNDAFMLLSNYLNDGALYTTGIPSWLDGANLETTTNISGTAYRQHFVDYYAARNVLVQAITVKLKALADTAQNGVDGNAGSITTINTALTTVQTNVNGIKTSVSSIDNQISNATDGIALRLSNTESTIEQHSAEIISKVEGSTFDAFVTDNGTALQDVATQITTIEQGLSDINLSISQTGYRNLLKNSAGKNGTNFWSVTGTVSAITDTNTSDNTVSNSAFSLSANSTISQLFSLKSSEVHTASLLCQSSTAVGHITVSLIQNSTETVMYDNAATGTDWLYITFPLISKDTSCVLKITSTVNSLVSDIIVSEGTNIVPWTQSDEELYTTNLIVDGTGLTIGSNTTDMKAHITTSSFEISRGDDLRINVAPDGTRLQKTIIEDDLTVGSMKEIVRGTIGVDFVLL